MYTKITHPVTGKKVSIKSILGKKILQKYLNFKKGGTGCDHAKTRWLYRNFSNILARETDIYL